MKEISTHVEEMTLKEITDLLDVRHNDAMKIVEKMAEELSFGMITKISYSYGMPNGGDKSPVTIGSGQGLTVDQKTSVVQVK